MSEHEYHSTPASSSSSSSSPDYIRAPMADAGQSDLRDRYDAMTYAHYDAADYEGHDRVSDSSPGPYPADASSASDFERVSSLAQSLSCRSPILTSSPLYRHLRSGALPQTQPPGTDPYPHSAIPAPIQNFTEQDGRHVPPLLVNGVSPSSTTQFQLEQAALHRYSTQVTQQNVSLDNYVARLRTPHSPVFNVSDLAAQHELPQSFPQPPCTAPQRTASNPQQQHIQPSSFTDSESLLEFYRMRNQYLQMHQEKVESPAAGNAQLPNVSPEDAAMAIADLFQAGGVSDMWGGTPMLDDSPGSAFLTSPFDSPLDDFLQTPQTAALSMPDIFTSPAQGAPFDSFETPLFDISKQPLYAFPTQEPAIDPSIVSSPSSGAMLHQFPTPVVAAPDNTRAIKNGSITASSSAAARRRNNPTGTRKNATPETLVPLDAPIQPRKYVTPSQTSRKEVPATFARKRARSQAFGEDDELAAEDVGSSEQPSKDEEEAIKQKRLQNTLAARRSRKRKLEYQRELEDTIEIERKEKEQWKSHALVLEALLVDKGFAPPPRPAI